MDDQRRAWNLQTATPTLWSCPREIAGVERLTKRVGAKAKRLGRLTNPPPLLAFPREWPILWYRIKDLAVILHFVHETVWFILVRHAVAHPLSSARRSRFVRIISGQ